MILLELLEKTEWNEVANAMSKTRLFFDYLEENKSPGEIVKEIKRLRNIFYALQTKRPITYDSEDDEETEIYFNDEVLDTRFKNIFSCHGYSKAPKKHLHDPGLDWESFKANPIWDLGGSSWEEWVGYNIRESDLEYFGAPLFIAGVLWEITWGGFYDHDSRSACHVLLMDLLRDGLITKETMDREWMRLYGEDVYEAEDNEDVNV